VLNSVVSAFYYLRITGMMFTGEPSDMQRIPSPAALKLALVVAAAGIVAVGIVPTPLIDAARDAAAAFAG
jgi:NADH:ubiquinone oxidoreductase subunit 2 (subunit N)